MGRKFRPIEEYRYSEDKIAQDLLRISTQGRFLKGPDLTNRMFNSASSGGQIAGTGLGGGVFSPASPTAGHVTKNGADAPSYPF